MKLEKDSEFTVNIDKDGYQSESVGLIADSDTIKATGSEAITLEEEEKEPEEPAEVWSFEGHTDWVRDVAVDAEGYVYSGGFSGTVRKIDPDGEEVWSFDGHTGTVYAVAVDDEGYVYSAGNDGTVRKIAQE